MSNTDPSVYESQKLIIPARINTNEPRRVATMLRELANQIDEVTPDATKKPKVFLPNYLRLMSTLRQVSSAAEDRCIRDWASIGGNKSEIQRITGISYSTVGRRAQANEGEQERHYQSVIERAERVVSGANGQDVQSSVSQDAPPQQAAKQSKGRSSENPYSAQDYAEV